MLPTIIHQQGPKGTALIRARWPQAQVREIGSDPIEFTPTDRSVLITGPSRYWRGAAAPEGWPGAMQWVQYAAAGLDGYPAWLLQVPHATTGQGVNAVPVAEFVMACMLAHEKRMPGLWVSQHRDFRPLVLGILEGRTLGIVGVGPVGLALAKRASAFGMRVIVNRRSRVNDRPAHVDELVSLGDLVERSDHIALALPSTGETRGMFNAALLARLKPSAHLINVARGDLIDQPAMLDALDRGVFAAASLDVTEPEPPPEGDPIYTHPKVRLAPHSAYSSPFALERLLGRFFENYDRWQRGEAMLYSAAR